MSPSDVQMCLLPLARFRVIVGILTSAKRNRRYNRTFIGVTHYSKRKGGPCICIPVPYPCVDIAIGFLEYRMWDSGQNNLRMLSKIFVVALTVAALAMAVGCSFKSVMSRPIM